MNDVDRSQGSVGLFDLPLGPIADALLDAIVIVDPRQDIVGLNPSALRLFGVTSREVLGEPLGRLIPERHRARHAEFFRAFDASGRAEAQAMGRAPVVGLRADGREFPAEASISRIELGQEGNHLFVAVLRDISIERSLRQELAALTQRMRTALDLAPVAIWIVDGERLSFVNRAARRLLAARDEEELVGQSIFALLEPATHEAVRTQLALALGGAEAPPAVSGRLHGRDGSACDVEIAASALPDHGRTVVQMLFNDVTERLRQDQEHDRHRQQLRQLSASMVDAREEERRRIARELHDELGQRLSAMKIELSALPPAPAAPGEGGSRRRLLEMLDDTVSAVRRISADLRPLMLDDLGLNAAIESLAREASQRMGIEVTVRLGEEDPPLSDAAAIALYRMIQEALTNVNRHARATDVRVDVQEEGDELVLTVQDNGVGFSAPSLRQEGRYGLLGIRERALALGGRVEVDNPPGGGARLRVRLPLRSAAPRGSA